MWWMNRPDGPLGKFFPQVCHVNETGGGGGGGRGGLKPDSNTAIKFPGGGGQEWAQFGNPSHFYSKGFGGGNTGGGSTDGGAGGDFDSKGSDGVFGTEASRGLGGPQGKNLIATNGLVVASNLYTTNISIPRIQNSDFSSNVSIEWTGKFYAPNTGNYKFQIISGDASYVWLGPTAASGYTLANANANNGGIHTATSNEFIVSLTSNTAYDLRIQHSNRLNSSNGVYFKFGQLDDGAGTKLVTEQLFDVPGTHRWICPPGVTNVSVVCVGGGGGGFGRATGFRDTTLNDDSSKNTGSEAPDSAAGGGGGGLGYKNNIVVVPGTAYTVVVGGGGMPCLLTPGGDGGNSYFNTTATVMGIGGKGGTGVNNGGGGAGGTYVGDGGGNGGTGGSAAQNDDDNNADAGGGGGAGGYSGAGGNGADFNNPPTATAGAGGGGGGGGTSNLNGVSNDPNVCAAGGGGVGVYGLGTSGAAGTSLINSGNTTTDSNTMLSSYIGAGGGGSGGQNGGIGGHSGYSWGNAYPNNPVYYWDASWPIQIPGLWPDGSGKGGDYGGGGGGAEGTYNTATGGKGAVRIVWATGALFPSTNVDQRTDLTTNGRGFFFSGNSLENPGLLQKKYIGWFGNSASYFATAAEYTTLANSLARANSVSYTNYAGGPTYVGYTADSYAHATQGLSKKTFNIAVPTGVQAGDILLFTARLALPSSNAGGDLWGGDSPAATMQDIEVWPATVNSQVGLYQNTYNGYFADNLGSTALSAANLTSTLQQVTVVDDRGVAATTTRQWTGWFYPRNTGSYSFYIASDDASYVWIGNNAAAATNTNANIIHNGTHSATVKGFSANFVANTFYQVRIVMGNSGAQGEVGFYWKGPETGGANTKSLTSQNWYLSNTANTTLVSKFTNLDNVNNINVWANGNTGSIIEAQNFFVDPVWRAFSILYGTAFFKYKVADALDASGAQSYLMTTNFGGAVSMIAVRNVSSFVVETPRYDANMYTFDQVNNGYAVDTRIDDYYKVYANQLSVGILSTGETSNTSRLLGAISSNGYSTVEKAANNRESIVITTYKATSDNLIGQRFDVKVLNNSGNTASHIYQRFDFF